MIGAERKSWFVASLVLGIAVSALGIVVEPTHGFSALLVAAFFGITLALGAAVVTAVNGVARAVWLRPIAALPVQIARTLPVAAVPLAIALLLGLGTLYPWAAPGAMHESPLLEAKAAWLNPPFFLARAILVLVAWMLMIGALANRVLDPARQGQLRRSSALFLVALAPTLSVAAWDWTMSLEPEWFSTMWAVYAFAGAFVSGIAALILLALLLDRKGLLATPLGANVRHDLGKLLFAFTSFWAYIWFCQYMLIWYANLPEEATWFARRFAGGWSSLFWLNPLLNWAVPFVALMSARAKKDPAFLAQVAACVLLGHWLDVYLMIEPALGDSPGVPLLSIGATVATLAAMGLLLDRRLRCAGIPPLRPVPPATGA